MIYIIRHGQTEMNRQKVLQGRSDLPLNEEGRKQAASIGAALQAEGIAFSHVYSSPLIRAVETARLTAGEGCEIQTDDRLLEMDYGPYEGMSLRDPAPEVITFFMDFVNNPAPEGMEPLEDVVKRSGEFVETLRELEGDILISAHAISMKGILEYLTPESKGAYWSKNIANCAVYKTEVKDGVFSVPAEHEMKLGEDGFSVSF
ncbi:MAG: histidine phosphatase family protein [Eubacteriales bacterium]|nr:histidine phosphatase family protein [Eubacteriales bacterium]